MHRQRVFAILFPIIAVSMTALLFEAGLRISARQKRASSEHDFVQRDPEVGWRHTPNLKQDFVNPHLEIHSDIETDAEGMRIYGNKPAELLVVGDSTVAGYEVKSGEIFLALAQKDTGVAIANAGVRGYGTDQAYWRLRELVPRTKPKAVLYFYCFNDIYDNLTLKIDYRPSKPLYVLSESGELELQNHPAAEMPQFSYEYRFRDRDVQTVKGEMDFSNILWRLSRQSKIFEMINIIAFEKIAIVSARDKWKANVPRDYHVKLTTAILKRMKTESPRLYVSAFVPSIDIPDNIDILREAASTAGVPYWDLQADFKGNEDYTFPKDGHWNVKGHAIGARALARYLKRPW